MAVTLSAKIQKSPAEEIPQGFLFVRLICDSFATVCKPIRGAPTTCSSSARRSKIAA